MTLSVRAFPGVFGNCNSALNAPTKLKSVEKSGSMDTGNFGPFSHGLGFAVGGEHPTSPSISHLYFSRCPLAIPRSIRPIIVDSLNCMFGGRRMPHVVKKFQEITFPFISNKYASAAVIWVALKIFIVTSGLYIAPSSVFFGVFHSVLEKCLSAYFWRKAPTTFCFSDTQTCSANNLRAATIAFAIPSSKASWSAGGSRNHNELAKTFPGHIFENTHIRTPDAFGGERAVADSTPHGFRYFTKQWPHIQQPRGLA